MPDDVYRDAHCWAFTPASFELIARDLRFLGLLGLDIDDVRGPNGCEFYVRLSKPVGASTPGADAEFYARRNELLHRINTEAAINLRDRYTDELKLRNAALAAKVDLQDADLRALRSSKSWRITAPGRALVRLLLGGG